MRSKLTELLRQDLVLLDGTRDIIRDLALQSQPRDAEPLWQWLQGIDHQLAILREELGETDEH